MHSLLCYLHTMQKNLKCSQDFEDFGDVFSDVSNTHTSFAFESHPNFYN